jgi:hypothetical protein
MTHALLEQRVVPLARKARSKPLLGPRNAGDGILKPIVVPCYTWAPTKIAPLLQSLCPREFDQIDPRIPTEIIALLADSEFPGWCETHVTFDEEDVVKRMQSGHEESYFFRWTSEQAWQTNLGDGAFSQRCLDVLAATCEKNPKLATERIEELRMRIYLPDTQGTARPVEELYVGSEMPPALAALGTPPLLHKRINSHALLKRRAWRLKAYSLVTFLESADLNAHTDTTRHAFFEWLRRNWAQIPKQYNGQLAGWRIWPDRTGSLHTLAALCLPGDPKVAAVLAGIIHQPAVDVVRLLARPRSTGTALALRTTPSAEELDTFYTPQLQCLPQDRALTNEEVAQLRQIEESLAVLARDKEIAAWFTTHPGVGLARDRVLRPVSALHREVPAVTEVSLQDRDLLERPETSLDRIHPPRAQPSIEALVRALTKDATRTEALIPRLRALSIALVTEPGKERPVENVACIPYDLNPA